ncbi:MAG: MarR family transcriptional regulator [Zoogloea sp.]|nr:MarR family transcriptional regulator [Zoogloea sp.]
MPKQRVMLTRLVTHVGRLLHDRIEGFLAGHGLHPASWSMLMMIYSSPEGTISPSRVSDALCQSRAHMTRVTDELTAAGWVERVPSAADRRSIDLQLTASGQRLVAEMLPLAWEYYRTQLPEVSEEELQQLESLLRRWAVHLEDGCADTPNDSTQETA